MLKSVSRSVFPHEVEIGQFFSSEPLASDPRNHCVPIYEILQDPTIEDTVIIVMPFLRLHNDPAFNTVGEVLECFKQIFEGLLFMHEHCVAHRDCMVLNVMMDPNPMFPELYHPREPDRNRDLTGRPKRYSRTEKPTRYYLIDFGLSRRYQADGPSPRELPILGGDKTVPEFQEDGYNQPSDPFATDVYYLGNLIRKHYLRKYSSLEFLNALVNDMTETDPASRPTMSDATMRFEQIYSGLSSRSLRGRLVKREEGAISRLFLDFAHFIVSAGYIIRRLPPIPHPPAS